MRKSNEKILLKPRAWWRVDIKFFGEITFVGCLVHQCLLCLCHSKYHSVIKTLKFFAQIIYFNQMYPRNERINVNFAENGESICLIQPATNFFTFDFGFWEQAKISWKHFLTTLIFLGCIIFNWSIVFASTILGISLDWTFPLNLPFYVDGAGAKVGTLGRQNERDSCYVRLAHTSIFCLCFMSVCLMKSNWYSLIYSSLGWGHILWKLFYEFYLKSNYFLEILTATVSVTWGRIYYQK